MHTLIQGTGKKSDWLFLLDASGNIVKSWRPVEGQSTIGRAGAWVRSQGGALGAIVDDGGRRARMVEMPA